jgi:hypothetical protein
MKVSEYRDHLRMAEILNKRIEYEEILYENKIFLNKSLRKLNRKTAANIVSYFMKNKNVTLAKDIIKMCEYYLELISLESIEIN